MSNSMMLIGSIINLLSTIYSWMLFIRVLLPLLRVGENRFTYWLKKAVDPVIDYFDKLCPIRIGQLNLSILVPFMLLWLIRLVSTKFLINAEPFTIMSLFTIALSLVGRIYGMICFGLFISTVALLIVSLMKSPNNHPLILAIRSVVDPMVANLSKVIKLKPSVYQQAFYYGILAVIVLAASIIGQALLAKFITFINFSMSSYYLDS